MKGSLLAALLLAEILTSCDPGPSSFPKDETGYGWSSQKELFGKTRREVIESLGRPKEVHSSKDALKPKYLRPPPQPKDFAQQWVFETSDKMGYTLVYLDRGVVVFAMKEHSDF